MRSLRRGLRPAAPDDGAAAVTAWTPARTPAGPPGRTPRRRRLTPDTLPGAGTTLLAVAANVTVASLTLLGGAAAPIGALGLVVVLYLVLRLPPGPVSLLVVMVYIVLLVPARLRIAPLGVAGTPAALVGMVAFTVWLYGAAFGRPWLVRRPQPLRWAMLAVACSVLASYLAMGYRVHDNLETRAANRGLLTVISMVGITLLAADGIKTRVDLRRVLNAAVTGGAIMAGIGIIQFSTGIDIGAKVRIPGFTFVSADYAASRSGFHRIVSTTSHPIELSVTLVLLLPLALHLAMTSPPEQRRRWWTCAAIIGITGPMTVSRTAIIALAVCLLVLFPGWPPRLRLRMGIAVLVGLAAMRAAIPGLLGTLKSFLINPGQDPSLASRHISAGYADLFVHQTPWLGRGYQTFLPTRYQFLDNQMLLSLVETGILGLAALLSVLVVSGVMTRIVRWTSPRFDDRDLAHALLACLLVGYATWFTYDALGFPTGRTLLFLCAGFAAALWRIAASDWLADPPVSAGQPAIEPEDPDESDAFGGRDSGRSLTRRAGLPA